VAVSRCKFALPVIRLPNLLFPKFQLPKIPSFSLDVDLPFDLPRLPILKLPTLGFPSFHLPKVPFLTLDIDLPGLPKFSLKLPTLGFPKFQLPRLPIFKIECPFD